MIRKEKQITDQKLINEILLNNTICRVALLDGEKPYIIPMNYGYKDGSFYFHTAPEGKKLDLIKKNNNVCIEVTDSIELVTSDKACKYGTKYRSVICTGTVYPVIEIAQKIESLKIIMKQHTGNSEWEIPESSVSNVTILKVDIETITGKISGI
jgi:nitroimidazol reductase NimA-like FMN-containing flavoprotein (pyridoxamine 5'-phosphate oxidase superfamily)